MITDLEAFFECGMSRDIPLLHTVAYDHNRFEYKFPILNVGCGNKKIEDTISLDYPEWDADSMPLPYDDNSIGGIYAFHFLEHCKYPVKVLQEFQRVLIKGGIVNIVVPYYTSQMQAHDLDHKHSFCEETWKNLFSTEYYDKNKINWEFEIGANVIMGVVERNLALLTQLIKV